MTGDHNFETTRQYWFGSADKCPACGTALEPGWTFCGSCGTAIEPPPPAGADQPSAQGEVAQSSTAPIVPAELIVDAPHRAERSEPSPSGPSRRVLAVALGLIVVLAAAGWGLEVKRSNELDKRDHELTSTRATLSDTSKDLASTKTDLDDTRSRLTQTGSELAKTKTDLAKAKGTISGAEHRLDLQAGQITTLKICLGGVQRALSDLAYSDFESALSELQSVQTACRKANDVL